MRIVDLNENTKKDLLGELLKRNPGQYKEYEDSVAKIIADVRDNGDKALFGYTLKYDGAVINADNLRVTQKEIDEAYQKVDEEFVRVLRAAIKNIESYHLLQKRNSWFDVKEDGIILGQKVTPVASVGVYVPGGRAAYPSSVLMNVLPAMVAGVGRIIMVTPPDKNGVVNAGTLVAAKEAGVTEIYKAGGAQAIAALAFGTESIRKVDKIVGPGNIFVALAKKAVYGHVSIDSIAGPSEILVLADAPANPRYVAADL